MLPSSADRCYFPFRTIRLFARSLSSAVSFTQAHPTARLIASPPTRSPATFLLRLLACYLAPSLIALQPAHSPNTLLNRRIACYLTLSLIASPQVLPVNTLIFHPLVFTPVSRPLTRPSVCSLAGRSVDSPTVSQLPNPINIIHICATIVRLLYAQPHLGHCHSTTDEQQSCQHVRQGSLYTCHSYLAQYLSAVRTVHARINFTPLNRSLTSYASLRVVISAYRKW